MIPIGSSATHTQDVKEQFPFEGTSIQQEPTLFEAFLRMNAITQFDLLHKGDQEYLPHIKCF